MAIAAVVNSPKVAVTRTLARQGVEAYGRATQWTDARTVTQQYLDSISTSGDTQVEKVVAQVTRNAGSAYLTNENAARCNVAGLNALAAGVGGAVGLALAQVGRSALNSAQQYDDARTMGQRFLGGISQHGNRQEQMVANVASEAASKYLTNKNGYQAQAAALEILNQGVGGSNEDLLARLGRDTCSKTDRWDDTRQMGYVFLQAIATHAEDSGKRIIAQSALNASGQYLTNEEGARIQMRAYEDILRA